MSWRGVGCGVAAAMLALLCGCGAGGGAAPSPSVVAGTPTVVALHLQVTLAGEPTRTFGGGHWRVCDHGTVSNPDSVVAHDVRVTVQYIDHGLVEAQTTRAEATGNGGALGDIQPGQARDFTVCGYAPNEPDHDTVSAAPGS